MLASDNLARLVGEQIVELLVVLGARKQPGSAAHQRVGAPRRASSLSVVTSIAGSLGTLAICRFS